MRYGEDVSEGTGLPVGAAVSGPRSDSVENGGAAPATEQYVG